MTGNKRASLARESGKDPSFSDLFSPTDFRYSVDDLKPYLSEESYVKYKARVEAALVNQLAKEEICSQKVADEVQQACERVSAKEVYEEEDRIKHDIRALANVIRSKVSSSSKPFIHLSATSYDIVDTANAIRLKDAVNDIILPDLVKLERALIELTLLYADTVQIGRTHGQHAEPTTFGYHLSYYVSRLGKRILAIRDSANKLTGKFSGAVGVYGPLSLIVKDPEKFERSLMESLGLLASEASTQIVQPEPISDFLHAVISTFGVLANFSRDMRHLQRTEISEVAEQFSELQVGSSTMPQKRNPISFENVESLWKRFMPQMVTVYLDQISEHQRDLTNSSSQRYLPELLVAFDYSIRRLTRTIWDSKQNKPKLVVDVSMLNRNLEYSADKISAEPLYVLLSMTGYPDAHELVRKVVQDSIEKKMNFYEVMRSNRELGKYLSEFPEDKKRILEHPKLYVGVAPKKARKIASVWKQAMSDAFD
ncbi:MAG: adenylosuccinate lyase [Nitrososphaerota archaeon]|nr:adenylosuccinate lyase [Nitrososphaerota archaeon]